MALARAPRRMRAARSSPPRRQRARTGLQVRENRQDRQAAAPIADGRDRRRGAMSPPRRAPPMPR